jgi:MFS family permease
MARGPFAPVIAYVSDFWKVDPNCKLSYSATLLNGLSQGIFLVVFNLYILAMGIPADVLGAILAAGPLAQAIGSIPLGFLAEKIGFRKVFIFIYGGSGLAKLVQVAGSFVPLISGAAFLSGLALAGDFVVRLSFLAANSKPEERTKVYSANNLIFSLSVSGGALIAGFLPNLFQLMGYDLIVSYRFTLFVAGMLSILAILPSSRIVDTPPVPGRRISLSPYLWGIDRFTVFQAITSLFVGLSIGMLNPFMNLYFVYHFGATREFFSTVSAFAIVFTFTATSLGPLLAARLGTVPSVSYLRMVIPVFLLVFAFTSSQYFGAAAFWMQTALFQMSQPLSFAFAMRAASNKAKSAASAWLNVTFWIGNAAAAPIVGSLIAGADYRTPVLMAAGSIILAGLLNHLFFGPIELSLNKMEAVNATSEAKAR